MGCVKVRWYSSCAAVRLTAIGKIADELVALVPASPTGLSVSLNQTAGERDERIVAALRERLRDVDVPLSVPLTRYEPQPDEALWFEVALHRAGDGPGGERVVAAWNAEVYVVGKRAPTRSVAPEPGPDPRTRALEAQVRALTEEGRRRTREIRALSDTLTEQSLARRADERKLREALDANEQMAETIAGLVQLNIEILAKSKTLAAEYRRVSRDH